MTIEEHRCSAISTLIEQFSDSMPLWWDRKPSPLVVSYRLFLNILESKIVWHNTLFYVHALEVTELGKTD